jgi:LuxR family maltose regulon positive regulatory protein
LGEIAGARTLLREIGDLLRHRPDLGILVDQTDDLRAQLALRGSTTSGFQTLSPAELRLLPLLSTHFSFREIGEELFVSPHTVKSQAISIYRKLGVSSRSEAVQNARKIGLLEG